MIKTEEITDIKEIEKVRKACKRELDINDNLSWHIALKEDEEILGVARLYIYKDGVMIDKPCLYQFKSNYFELLYRTLLLKAITLKKENIYTYNDECNLKYGFKACGDLMKAPYNNITFPDCGGCC